MISANDTSHHKSSLYLVQHQAQHYLLGAALDLAACELLFVLQVTSVLLSLQPVNVELSSPEHERSELAA